MSGAAEAGLDPEGVVTFAAKGRRYAAVFSFRAMKAAEVHYDLPFFQALQKAMPGLTLDPSASPEALQEAAANVRVSELAKLFEFSLLKHQPDIGEDDVEDIIDALGLERVGAILGLAVRAAVMKGGDDASPANPPSRPSRRARKTG